MKKFDLLSVNDYKELREKVRNHVAMYIPVPQDVEEKTQDIVQEIVSHYSVEELLHVDFEEVIRNISYKVCTKYLESNTVSNNFPLHHLY